MSIIIIPAFKGRISPRFDCAETFLLVRTEGGEIKGKNEINVNGRTPLERIGIIREHNADTLICSGIDRASARHIGFSGIRIYSWITGNTEDALNSFLKGELKSGAMMGPGGRQCGQWKFRNRSGGFGKGFGRQGKGQGRGSGNGFGRRR